MEDNNFNDVKLNDLSEIEDKKEINFNFKNNLSYLYSILFYICGLLLGSFLYRKFANDTINSLIVGKKSEFLQLFTNDFCLYFSIFLLTVFLGYCLIGYPLVNVLPLIIGFVSSTKIAYYYITYSSKGIVYCIIMIVPSVALLMTVVALSIKVSTDLSKSIYNVSVKKADITEIEFKLCLKKYLLYGVTITLTALFDAGITTIFSSIISI